MKQVVLSLLLVISAGAIAQEGPHQTGKERFSGVFKNFQHWYSQIIPENGLRWVNKNVGFWLRLPTPAHKQASDELQELATEAQKAVGIPPEYHLPLRNGTSRYSYMDGTVAECEPNALYIYPRKIEKYSKEKKEWVLDYPLMRISLFHEAIHAKYCDPLVTRVSFFFPFLCYWNINVLLQKQTSLKLLQKLSKNPVWKTANTIASVVAGTKIYQNIAKMVEYRADVEAAEALKCYECAWKMAWLANSSLMEEGYASKDELMEIVNHHSHNKLDCKFHIKENIQRLEDSLKYHEKYSKSVSDIEKHRTALEEFQTKLEKII